MLWAVTGPIFSLATPGSWSSTRDRVTSYGLPHPEHAEPDGRLQLKLDELIRAMKGAQIRSELEE